MSNAREAKASLVAFALAALLTACASVEPTPQAAAAPRPISTASNSVLFVGNSFTYYNNSVHHHYRGLVRVSGRSAQDGWNARSMTISGGRLPEHAAGLPPMLEKENWDVVVLQGHSREPIEAATADSFRQTARELASQIRRNGARPVFFMTWAYASKPEMTAMLAQAYTEIGRELNAQVVPVGLVFAQVSEERPDIVLRTADGLHPTLAGTYLAACTFYAALLGESPLGLGYRAGLEDAEYLQKTAYDIVARYAPATP